MELITSSISFSIVSVLDNFSWSLGFGKLLKSGGNTNGFFFITKNSSLDSYFFPESPSFIEDFVIDKIKN